MLETNKVTSSKMNASVSWDITNTHTHTHTYFTPADFACRALLQKSSTFSGSEKA